jgi:putative ABC transport system permease protein
MIKNYIKTAFRSLMKNKGFTFINVFGLALGLATCLLIVFYVFDELSYDRYNEKADRIYRVNNDIKFGGNDKSYAVSPAPMAAALKADFPDVEYVTRFRDFGGFRVKKGAQNIQENNMIWADASVFSVFTLPMIGGDPATALAEPHSVVINEKMAQKYFNSTNVVGKTLTFNDTVFYKVTGVIKNIPKQSHFDFDFFLSMSSLPESRDLTWLSNNFNTYVVLRSGADPNKLAAQFPAFLRKHGSAQLQAALHMDFDQLEKGGSFFKFSITPLKDIHLHSNRVAELGPNGNILYVYIFSAIALFILLIACVNFMNLSTARSANRAREVGVRKVLGSPRKFLIAQFLTESVMVTLIAAIIAIFTAWGLLPFFNNMAGKQLTVTPQVLAWLLPVMLIIVMVVGCLAGSYPALYLSGFQPINVLKGKIAAGFRNGLLRSFLVVFQFAISIFLIIGAMVIYNQLKYIQSRDLGYNRDHVLVVQNTNSMGTAAKTFKEEVKKLPGVQNATLTGFIPTGFSNNSNAYFKDQVIDPKRSLQTQEWSVDEDYFNTLGIKIIAGRGFSKDMPTDSSAVVINESAARLLDFKDPLNQTIYKGTDNTATKMDAFHIIGVMKDFNFQSLRENVTPMLFILKPNRGALSVRINTADIPSMLAQVKAKWTSIAPNQEFVYSFMDKDFEAQYRSEQRIGTIFVSFTTLAILIACLGLFGLAAYATEQRTKEIGIRKVLGANISSIVNMLSKDFIKLVCIAILIASPLAWWVAHTWLQTYAYHQNVSWWIFASAGLGAILIAFVTVSFQSIKAALTNPVKSLKSE